MPGATTAAPNPLFDANYAEHGAPGWRRSLLRAYTPGPVTHVPVQLLLYAPGTVVAGGAEPLVHAGGCFVQEQMPPWPLDLDRVAEQIACGIPSVREMHGDHLLLARYGETVWGHWVFELLPKAILAEGRYPGRFRFVLGDLPAGEGVERGYIDSVLESLAAAGIGADRVVVARRGSVTRFRALFDTTPTRRQPDAPHPGVLRALRALPAQAAPVRAPRIAVRRRSGRPRAVANFDALRPFLEAHRFLTVDLEATPFAVQTALFRGAETVVASLGSDCAGLVWSGPGTRVLTVAPALWADAYFPPLFAERRLAVADLRGPSSGGDPAIAPHVIDPGLVERAFGRLSEAHRPEARRVAEIDGEILPARPFAAAAELSFGLGGNARPYFGEGWAAPETHHCWSVGPSCALRVPDEWPRTDLLLEVCGLGVVAPPALATKPLAAYADDLLLARWETIGDNRLFCVLPASWRGGVWLTFHHPHCPSPRALGLGDDARPLGFGFQTIRAAVL